MLKVILATFGALAIVFSGGFLTGTAVDDLLALQRDIVDSFGDGVVSASVDLESNSLGASVPPAGLEDQPEDLLELQSARLGAST